jgi:hypothetical protein
MKKRFAPVLLAAIVIAGGGAARASADLPPPDAAQPVLAMTADFTQPWLVPPGMTVVFVPPAGDGFSDGGDGPGGLEWIRPCGFADGGDVPEGYIAALARPAGDDFWLTGYVPDGLLPVLAQIPPDGFADGGDIPDGFIPVLFSVANNSGGTGGTGG